MRIPPAGVLLVGVLGCASVGPSSEATPFKIVPLFDRYEPGATVRVSLINETGAVVYRNTCEATIQRRNESGAWITAGGRTCPPIGPTGVARVESATSAHLDIPTPLSLRTGDYRIVLDLRYEDGSLLSTERRTSEVFRIE